MSARQKGLTLWYYTVVTVLCGVVLMFEASASLGVEGVKGIGTGSVPESMDTCSCGNEVYGLWAILYGSWAVMVSVLWLLFRKPQTVPVPQQPHPQEMYNPWSELASRPSQPGGHHLGPKDEDPRSGQDRSATGQDRSAIVHHQPMKVHHHHHYQPHAAAPPAPPQPLQHAAAPAPPAPTFIEVAPQSGMPAVWVTESGKSYHMRRDCQHIRTKKLDHMKSKEPCYDCCRG